MSIRGCPSCQGTGWLPRGYKDKNWRPELGVLEGPPHANQWELCWCNQGTIVKGPPAFWKDKKMAQQVFLCSYEDLEEAVSNFLEHIEPSPKQMKLLKFCIAQWVTKDPQPPWGWLERLAGCIDWESLNDYARWLESQLITPFGGLTKYGGVNGIWSRIAWVHPGELRLSHLISKLKK